MKRLDMNVTQSFMLLHSSSIIRIHILWILSKYKQKENLDINTKCSYKTSIYTVILFYILFTYCNFFYIVKWKYKLVFVTVIIFNIFFLFIFRQNLENMYVRYASWMQQHELWVAYISCLFIQPWLVLHVYI